MGVALNAPRKFRMIARYGAETAVIKTFGSETKAQQLVDELRREHRGQGACFWAMPRKHRPSSSWADLQGRLLRGEPPVAPVTPETDDEEDRVLARGGTIRRLVWRPL
jgi:hypothetical protein